MVSLSLEEHWMLGDAPGGYLCTNNGIRALLRVLKEIFDHIEYENSKKFHKLKENELFNDIDKYTDPLIEYFAGLNAEKFSYHRNRTALKGVNKNTMRMLSIIHKEYPEFHPKKLEKYLEKIDEEGTEEARKMIDEISRKMYEFVIGKLIDKHDDKWWYEGVPNRVRNNCAGRQEDDKVRRKKSNICCY